jgi:heme exporter protein D
MQRAFLPMRGRLRVTVSVFAVLAVLGGLGALNWLFAIGGTYGLATEIAQLVGVLVAMVVFISWLKRAYWNAAAVEPGVTRHDPAWIPTVWFVPPVNHYRPLQMVNDVWRAARLGGASLPTVWWITFVVQGWAWWVAAFVPDELLKAYVWNAADFGYSAAALLALAMVLQATRGLEARHAEQERAAQAEQQRRFARPAIGQLEALRVR